MATAAGAIIEAIGDALATAFPGYSVVYGQPSASNGMRVETANTIRVHWAQSRTVASASQLAGVTRVQPILIVTLTRAYSSSSTDLATHQASLDLASDLRLAVLNRILGAATDSPISGLSGQSIWAIEWTETPGVLDIGVGQSTESVTLEITLNHTNTFGER